MRFVEVLKKSLEENHLDYLTYYFNSENLDSLLLMNGETPVAEYLVYYNYTLGLRRVFLNELTIINSELLEHDYKMYESFAKSVNSKVMSFMDLEAMFPDLEMVKYGDYLFTKDGIKYDYAYRNGGFYLVLPKKVPESHFPLVEKFLEITKEKFIFLEDNI